MIYLCQKLLESKVTLLWSFFIFIIIYQRILPQLIRSSHRPHGISEIQYQKVKLLMRSINRVVASSDRRQPNTKLGTNALKENQ